MTTIVEPLIKVKIGKNSSRLPVACTIATAGPATPAIDLKTASYRMLLYCESPSHAAMKAENSCQSANKKQAVTANSQQPTMRR